MAACPPYRRAKKNLEMGKCNQRRKVGMVIFIAIEFAAGLNPGTEVKALLLLAVKVIETVFHPLSYV